MFTRQLEDEFVTILGSVMTAANFRLVKLATQSHQRATDVVSRRTSDYPRMNVRFREQPLFWVAFYDFAIRPIPSIDPVETEADVRHTRICALDSRTACRCLHGVGKDNHRVAHS